MAMTSTEAIRLDALLVADHLPVASDEVSLLLALDVILDIIALYGKQILINLNHIFLRKLLLIVKQHIHRDEKIIRDF